MNEKSDLLSQLKIERVSAPEPGGRGLRYVLIALVAVALGAGGYLWSKKSAAIPVHVATALVSANPQAASVLDASGYVVARRQATVSSKITGKVVDILIEEGKRVEKDQVLAHIDDSNVRAQLNLASSQLDSARALLAEIRVQLADSERTLKRTQELVAQNLESQAALDSAQAAVDELKARLNSTQQNVSVAQRTVEVQNRQLDDTIVRAPFAGVITVKNAQPGEMISPLSAGGAGTRTGIGTLVDMDSLEVEVDVNESFINRVVPNQPVNAILNAYPDWKIPCEVIAVIPAADRSKATVKVRIGFKEHDPRILPDMGVRVSFLSPESENTAATAEPAKRPVLVPSDAVLESAGTTAVFVVQNEHVERRAVKVGGKLGDNVQVLSGLNGGEQLVVGDLDKLSDGAQVKILQ